MSLWQLTFTETVNFAHLLHFLHQSLGGFSNCKVSGKSLRHGGFSHVSWLVNWRKDSSYFLHIKALFTLTHTPHANAIWLLWLWKLSLTAELATSKKIDYMLASYFFSPSYNVNYSHSFIDTERWWMLKRFGLNIEMDLIFKAKSISFVLKSEC